MCCKRAIKGYLAAALSAAAIARTSLFMYLVQFSKINAANDISRALTRARMRRLWEIKRWLESWIQYNIIYSNSSINKYLINFIGAEERNRTLIYLCLLYSSLNKLYNIISYLRIKHIYPNPNLSYTILCKLWD